MYTRREFGRLALTGLVLPTVASADSVVDGVHLGVQTYSYRSLPRAADGDAVAGIIAAMTGAGLSECELWSPQLEPPKLPRDEARRWRLTTPMDHFAAVRKRFAAAGISVYAYNYSFKMDFTDDEIDRGFEMARSLGAEIITASSTLDAATRVAPFADRHKMPVAMHNHSNLTDPNEFATPASFAAAQKLSKFFRINLDIGHFTAANFDAVAFIREHHAAITNLHLKDRKKSQGDTTAWGEGDAPIAQTLQLLKREKWPIRAYIEYEYKGAASPPEEVKKCYEFAKQALRAS